MTLRLPCALDRAQVGPGASAKSPQFVSVAAASRVRAPGTADQGGLTRQGCRKSFQDLRQARLA